MTDTKVGYRNPPKHSQFKPGQSGNPKGRTKGSRNTYSLLNDMFNQKLWVTQPDGNKVKIDKRQAILIQMINSAIKGNLRAIQQIMPYMLAVDENNKQLAAIRNMMSSNDMAILKNLRERLLADQNMEETDV